jgi:iron(III) transport system permease protein
MMSSKVTLAAFHGVAGRLRHRLAVIFQDPTLMIGGILLIVFLWLIAAPLVSILSEMFISQTGDGFHTGTADGGLTAYYLQRVFNSRMSSILFFKPLMHTLVIASITVVFAITLGTLLGWLVTRTDLLGRKWFSTALIVPYMLPGWTFALAWMTIFKNHTVGGQPGWAESMGFLPPNWLSYGALPSVIIFTLHYMPFAILLIGNALNRMDSQLEDAARILGAPRRIIVRSIILPLMRPAVLSASLLIFADAVGEFAVVYVLGLPVNYNTLSTSLYRAITTQQNGVAAVFAGVIMLIGIITLAVDVRMTREIKRFATIGGKGSMDRRHVLGRLRIPAFILAAFIFLISVALPLMTLTLSTVMKIPGRFSWDNFTFEYWLGTGLHTVGMRSGILLSHEFWTAAVNTLCIVGAASVSAGILGILVGYVVTRSPLRTIGFALRQITFLPFLVPGIAFGAAFLALFAVPHGPVPALYGTPYILLLALIADQMPFASRSGIAAMTQLGHEAEDAGRIAGAGWLRRMTAIVLPIQRGALVTGVLLPFISGIKNVSLFVILAIPATDVLSTFSLRLVDYNYEQAANAVVLTIALTTWGGTMLINRITKTGLAQSIEGR